MCMDKETITEIGEAVGIVEEVTTDAVRECVGNIARLRVNVDITKPLKKMIVLKEENEGEEENRSEEMEEEEGAIEDREKTVNEVHMPIVYERLPNFCFCCGIIGHQYRECIKYKNQPQDQLEFGPHLKAITSGERMKQDRDKNRRKPEDTRVSGKIQVQTTKENNHIVAASENQNLSPPNSENGITQIQSGREVNCVGRSTKDGMAADNQLMQKAHNPKEIESRTKQQEPTEDVTSSRKMSSYKSNTMEGNRERETEVESPKKKETKEEDRCGKAKENKLDPDVIKEQAQKQTSQEADETKEEDNKLVVWLKPKARK